jgi:hypothetical protein
MPVTCDRGFINTCMPLEQGCAAHCASPRSSRRGYWEQGPEREEEQRPGLTPETAGGASWAGSVAHRSTAL